MIEITNLSQAFEDNIVLSNLTLTVQEGQTTVIIGRSGAGKSVFLKCIVGILRPDSGSIKINGVEVTTLPEKEYNKIRKDIGMVFQGGALFDSLNVGENVSFFLDEFSNLDASVIKAKVSDSLALVGLKGIEKMMTAQLSGGMKKRVSLARVLCMEPRIILYDEPTTGVDPITADAINNLIVELSHKLKVTSIVVTHDMNSAYKIADSIAMFYHGQIIAQGTPDEIRQTNHPIVKQFIHGEAHGPITDGEQLVFGHAK
ncbi:MAG: ABC transporter ATP-binding protein [Candidatus Omnitrophica bacterium]|nr:ABC transporter ATP-binding protein [Candidatus Omnitrophota bacterium]